MAQFLVSRRVRSAALGAILGVGMMPPLALAGSIGFRVTTGISTGPGVRATVEMTNTGDEAAFGVTPVLLLGDHEVSGERSAQMLPNAPRKWEIPVVSEDLPGGSYVAVTRVQYEDANGYPFEVLTATPFDVGVKRRPAAGGSLVVPSLAPGRSAEGKFSLKIPQSRGRKYEVRFVAPRGSTISPDRQTVEVNQGGVAEIVVRVRNTGILAGNVTAAFVLISSLDESPAQTDMVRATIRAATAGEGLQTRDFLATLAALAVTLIVLEILARVYRRPGAAGMPRPWGWILGAVLASATSAFLMLHYPWDALLADTVAAGGDMASLYYPTKLMAEEMLPRGQVTGWTMGNYAGFPILHFYSTLPFAVIALLGKLWPMKVVFKVVTLAGPTLLPIMAAVLFRALGYGPGAPAIAAASVLPFLMQQGNSMWGGNIPSVLAGEYCHAIGLSLGLLFLAQLHRVVNGRGSWPLAGVLLAMIGLCHTFAFFAAVWYSLFFLRPHANLARTAPPILATYGLAFLLLCFWGLPLPSRLVFTTEWSMIWNIKDWKEVLPSALWPASTLAALSCLLALVRVKSFSVDRMGMLMFNAGGGILLYYVVPALGFPDIRFIPVSQIFISLLAADFLVWVGSRLRQPHLYAACIVTAALAWGHSHLGYIPSWLKWNYSGYEGKPTWQLFKAINDHIAGDFDDPRVMFEHAEAHNRFGSSRAFENIPLFSGRATIEGVFHQASQSSPFIFYLQSEASERASGPFPQHTYTRLNPAKALPHLRLFNVSEIVAVTDKAKAAYNANPDFEKTFSSGAYAVYKVREMDTRYVVPVRNEPVLYDGPDWKIAFYRWFKHPELLDIPLVPADLLKKSSAREFALRTDSVTRIPKQPIAGDCNVTSHLENYRIEFETDCPERPHILKVSYFPRWISGDTAEVYPVSPGFMLVYPHQRHVVLEYKRTAIDWAGVAITGIGLLLALATTVSKRARDAVTGPIAILAAPLVGWVAAHRVIVTGVAVVAMVGVGAYTRYSLRAPERSFQAAQDAYRNRDFPEAIRRLEEWTKTDKDTFKQATALHQLGLSYSETKQYGSAVEVLERLRFEFPNVDYGAATLFHLAKAWDALGDHDKARAYATILTVDFADSPLQKRLARELPGILPAQQ
jgi:hypothetical protein